VDFSTGAGVSGPAKNGFERGWQSSRGLKGLVHIIIRAQAQPFDLVIFISLDREHDHGDTAPPRAASSNVSKAVQLRHHHIEDDQIGKLVADLIERFQPVGRLGDAIAFQFQFIRMNWIMRGSSSTTRTSFLASSRIRQLIGDRLPVISNQVPVHTPVDQDRLRLTDHRITITHGQNDNLALFLRRSSLRQMMRCHGK